MTITLGLLHWHWGNHNCRVASPVLGQSYDCQSADDLILNDMDKIDWPQFYHDVDEIFWPQPIRSLKFGHVTCQGSMSPTLDCFTSHVGEHRTVRGLWKRQGIPCFFKIPTVQHSPEEETPFVYVTLATLITLATAGYTPCLFGYVTIGLARHNRTHFSQSERLLVKPKRPCTDLCAEPVGVWNRLPQPGWDGCLTREKMALIKSLKTWIILLYICLHL